MPPKVSVITAIYKAEQTIQRFAESMMNQTLADVEFIMVNDATPDDSIGRLLEVVSQYPERKNQVKIISHETNLGVSRTRQDGLDAATGEYVIHADPDDYADPDMLEQLYNAAKEQNADMVICDFFYSGPTGDRIVRQQPESLDAESVQRQLFKDLHGSCCNKLTRLQAIRSAGITFPQNYAYCEDLTFNVALLNSPLRIAYLPKAFYHYVWVPGSSSIVGKYSRKIFEEDKLLIATISDLLSDRPATRQEAMFRLHTGAASRAFRAGTFSAKEFKTNFLLHKEYLLPQGSGSRFYSAMFKLAIAGHYSMARFMWTLKENISRLVRK